MAKAEIVFDQSQIKEIIRQTHEVLTLQTSLNKATMELAKSVKEMGEDQLKPKSIPPDLHEA